MLSLSKSSQGTRLSKTEKGSASASLSMVRLGVQSGGGGGGSINNAKLEKLLFSLVPAAAQKRLIGES